MIGNKIRPSPGLAPKIRAAIGAPAARDFLLAQNTAAISSAVLNFRARAVRVVIHRIIASRTAADPRQAIDRVNRLIASSHLQSQKDALRAALAGQYDSGANLPKPPLYLILLEHPANRIIEGRPYKSPADLDRVDGIGPRTIERLKPHLEIR